MKQKPIKYRYSVHGWINGDDYDNGKDANMSCMVTAEDRSRAEYLGELRMQKKVGTLDVVTAYYVSDK